MQKEISQTVDVQADFHWRPDQKAINGLMLQAGADPTADSYYSALDKCVKSIRESRIRYTAQITISTKAQEKLAGYSGDGLKGIVDEAVLAGLKRADAAVKAGIVASHVKGFSLPREIDYGIVPATVEIT